MKLSDVELLKDYTKDGSFLFIVTKSKAKIGFKFIDFDGKDIIIGKKLDNRYRKLSADSIESINLEKL